MKEDGDLSIKKVEKNGINLKKGWGCSAPAGAGTGDADSHASDVGHWLGMTGGQAGGHFCNSK